VTCVGVGLEERRAAGVVEDIYGRSHGTFGLSPPQSPRVQPAWVRTRFRWNCPGEPADVRQSAAVRKEGSSSLWGADAL
jgi:hypothetical protein